MATDAKLTTFLAEVKSIEKRDTKWTSATQIERLTKEGAKYRNLNPYEVLQLDEDHSSSELKKQYRKLSILVHPDKNHADRERAEKAFEAVSTAYKMMQDEDMMSRVGEVMEEARFNAAEKLRTVNRERKKEGQPPILENSPTHKEMIRNAATLLFAKYEKRRQELEKRESELTQQAAEEAEKQKAAKRRKTEFKEAWEGGREERLDSWRQFKGIGTEKKKKKKKKTAIGLLKPPKLKTETR
jgi:DnaJ family protein C protein 8